MSALPAAGPSFRHVEHRLSDPDEFGVALSGASLAADFLAPQERPTRVEQFQTPAWALDFHEAHVKARIRCPLPPGWASLGFMRSATASAFHGFAAEPGVVVCNPPGEAIDGRIAPGFTCLAVHVPTALWEQCRDLAGRELGGLRSAAVIRLPHPLHRGLEERIAAMHRHLSEAASDPRLARFAAREAAAFASDLAVIAWESSAALEIPRDSIRNRARLARRAETWMGERLAEAVQVPDVCLALRVSRRELEYAFRGTFDQSPRDFLAALRLNAIRRTLRRTEARITVLDVAFDYGITHLGRFAAHYRRFFGERPSATRRRDGR